MLIVVKVKGGCKVEVEEVEEDSSLLFEMVISTTTMNLRVFHAHIYLMVVSPFGGWVLSALLLCSRKDGIDLFLRDIVPKLLPHSLLKGVRQ